MRLASLPGYSGTSRTPSRASRSIDVSYSSLWRFFAKPLPNNQTLRLPLAGAYLLRGVDLRVSTSGADTWESRFVMLGFEAVKP